MIIYNVTIKVENDVAGEWVAWMKEEHMSELVSTGLFKSYRLSRLLEQDETEGVTYIAQYFCDSLREYDRYIADHAQTMRNKGFSKFGNKFIAFRSVMEILDDAM